MGKKRLLALTAMLGIFLIACKFIPIPSADLIPARPTPTPIPPTFTPIPSTPPPSEPTPSPAKPAPSALPGEIPHIYHKPEGWNGKCIIFIHGLGGSKERWLKDMAAFEKEGFCTFAFDLPLHGERGKTERPVEIPLVIIRGSNELVTVADFLRKDGAKEVYLVSRSLGSIVAGVALGKGAKVDKAELLLAAANLKYLYTHRNVKVPFRLRNEEILKRIDPLYFLPNYTGKIHFHCGKEDNVLPPETCQFAYEAATAASERKLFWHDTGHRMPLEEYFDEALEFFSSPTAR